jgi:hypothetical protein
LSRLASLSNQIAALHESLHVAEREAIERAANDARATEHLQVCRRWHADLSVRCRCSIRVLISLCQCDANRQGLLNAQKADSAALA